MLLLRTNHVIVTHMAAFFVGQNTKYMKIKFYFLFSEDRIIIQLNSAVQKYNMSFETILFV